MSEFATKTDVESIVTRVVSNLVTTLVPPIVEKIVDQKLDEKLDKKLDERFDAFAIMVGNGFAQTQAQINEIRQEMVTKTEFGEFKGDTEHSFFCLQSDVTDLKDRMGKVENRLDGVEGAIGVMTGMWRDHEVRIVDLEGSSA